ncbi:MAG: TraB/GumN family protein [Planctomycetes bacterium]|nr:TraB/GumN family protein [Planctomycetota bacterium]MCB9868949.1 TraB/GumN family protein [Planctomycetota bacterium]
MKRILSLALAAALLSAWPAAQAATAKPSTATKYPFLWRIEGKERSNQHFKSYLLGTMHLGDRRLVDIPEVVDKALAGADALYCELAMDEAQKMAPQMMLKMQLPPGESLSGQLPRDLYARLDARLRKLGTSAKRFDRFRLWGITVLVTQLEATKAGMTESLDMTLYKDAKSDGLTVGGLETFEEQLDALSQTNKQDSIALLRKSLDYMAQLDKSGKSAIGVMLDAYLTGREDALLDAAEESMGTDTELNDRVMRPLLEARNVKMTERIIEKIEKDPKKSFFFAIGALHFVGKEGIITMLRKKGYKVRRVTPPQPTWEEFLALRQRLEDMRRKTQTLERELAAAKK